MNLTDPYTWLLIAVAIVVAYILIVVRNNCNTYAQNIKRSAARIESAKIKLNRVYAEVKSLLNKYSIHEADILKQIVAGTANIKVLGIKYPQLKADGLFLNASANWDSLYTQLQSAVDDDYNIVILGYNNYVTTFPRNIVCSLLGYKEKINAVIT